MSVVVVVVKRSSILSTVVYDYIVEMVLLVYRKFLPFSFRGRFPFFKSTMLLRGIVRLLEIVMRNCYGNMGLLHIKRKLLIVVAAIFSTTFIRIDLHVVYSAEKEYHIK